MEALGVTHSALANASVDMRTQASHIAGVMDDLEAALKSKLQANWEGQASQSFDAAKRKFAAGMTDLNSLLDDIAQLVSDVNDRYKAVDQQQSGVYSA